jgi:hypothetical protein
MKTIVLGGAIIFLLGLLGMAIPAFTTQQTKEVAKLGDVHVDANETQTHTIPPLLSEGAIGIGLVLVVAGLVARK